ncbi:MAG: EF2563 family selenium-dependent molybdenum hydroxylase system protein [Mogibacterium sp.]|nr:EF2563 family selenium-dependent molybdenum hydroxylase system protein [Mogibacterium sp.]
MIRGAGDIATGSIYRLFKAGFRPIILEVDKPSAIRRTVSFSEAVYDEVTEIEGVRARLVENLNEAVKIAEADELPIIKDAEGRTIWEYAPDALVDAILAKRNLGTNRSMAALTIALGPGFEAGVDCDFVIETMRGHNLGRIIKSGSAMPNTGVPGVIAGVSRERVIYSPSAGIIRNLRKIGDVVQEGELIAYIEGAGGIRTEVKASISGLLRGLIREGYEAKEGFKIADIDPRLGEHDNCFTISDKARAIGGSVLEIITADYMSK